MLDPGGTGNACTGAKAANTTSLEEFLEVGVHIETFTLHSVELGTELASPASQTGDKSDTCNTGDVCKAEETDDERETNRRGSGQDCQGGNPRCEEEHRNERMKSRTFNSLTSTPP